MVLLALGCNDYKDNTRLTAVGRNGSRKSSNSLSHICVLARADTTRELLDDLLGMDPQGQHLRRRRGRYQEQTNTEGDDLGDDWG